MQYRMMAKILSIHNVSDWTMSNVREGFFCQKTEYGKLVASRHEEQAFENWQRL